MAHLISPAETELAKALCEMAGIGVRQVQRVELIMEVGCATVVRLRVLALDDQSAFEPTRCRLREFKLVPVSPEEIAE